MPVRVLARPVANPHLGARSYPLAGVLAGCRMRSRVIGAYREGSYKPEVCQVVKRIVQSGWVYMDIGAYVGYFTLLLAKLVGEREHDFRIDDPAPTKQRVRKVLQGAR